MRQDNIEISLYPIASERLIEKDDVASIPNWRPSCLKLPFFAAAILVTLLHSVMCAVLLFLSYTDGTIFTFSADSVGSYLSWQFVPIILAVVPGLMWEIPYLAMCRMQPYQDLASPQGATLKDSLSQDYLTAFSWVVPYQALKHPNKHTALAMMSIAYLLSYGVLPTATSAMISIQWDDDTDATQGTAQPVVYFIILALVISLSTSAFAITSLFILRRQRSGVYDDPVSIAGLGALVSESDLLDKFRALQSFDTQANIDKALGSYHLCLEHMSKQHTSYQISLLDPNQVAAQVPNQKFVRNSLEAHPWWLRGRTYLCLTAFSFVPQIVATLAINDSSVASAYIVKICYTILTLISAAIWANWHMHVAILQPFYDLTERQGNVVSGSSDALEHNFVRSAISNLTRGPWSFEVWWIAMCAFLTQLNVIINPAVYQNRAFMVTTIVNDLDPDSTGSSVPAGVQIMTYIAYGFSALYLLFVLVGLILVMKRKRKPFLPRKPHTLSSVLLYLCHGTEVLEDLRGISTLPKKAREHRLTQSGRKYGLGWIEDERGEYSHVGIDRIEKIGSRFVYPTPDLPQLRARSSENIIASGRSKNLDCWPENAR